MSHDHDHTSPAALSAADDELFVCPVMPSNVVVKQEAEEAGLYRDYEGQRYWLCCGGCGPRFDADPERFVAAAATLPSPREVLSERAAKAAAHDHAAHDHAAHDHSKMGH
jgi:YHS domain-containing protein